MLMRRSPVNYHAADGSGYEFLGDMVLKVDKINHQVGCCSPSCPMSRASVRMCWHMRFVQSLVPGAARTIAMSCWLTSSGHFVCP